MFIQLFMHACRTSTIFFHLSIYLLLYFIFFFFFKVNTTIRNIINNQRFEYNSMNYLDLQYFVSMYRIIKIVVLLILLWIYGIYKILNVFFNEKHLINDNKNFFILTHYPVLTFKSL